MPGLQLINQSGEYQLTIDNLYITDQYHIVGIGMPNNIVKDIVYPMTVGRQAMLLGGEHTDETSLSLAFSDEHPFENIIYCGTYEELWSTLATINDTIQSRVTHTVACHAFSVSNVRTQMSMVGKAGVRMIGTQQVVVQMFTLNLSKYRV